MRSMASYRRTVKEISLYIGQEINIFSLGDR
jgi:hypothetical protein